jgi:hypothetical protein
MNRAMDALPYHPVTEQRARSREALAVLGAQDDDRRLAPLWRLDECWDAVGDADEFAHHLAHQLAAADVGRTSCSTSSRTPCRRRLTRPGGRAPELRGSLERVVTIAHALTEATIVLEGA